MQIFIKYLFTKNNGHVNPIVYRIEGSWRKGHGN